ncbi:hypothetical protein METBIDRAFT_170969 [Metschnikowia bicuspidata var. bicuspidata NRRL YB-4993]|uniref:Uncharacterized protein n=1 Tax=Metschnikowia bicuspidata var. bicuspidata NRRL YB-4993 TaxID=869754 RepID=A0A1A0HAH1_9ASCO|nr:hypothetical protein METBIDRAFT_170969 [Metschnikowia bicuspidata var. bicuspidata NRRL YB-4993]OBA21000.1 hypothetical protein METBIDRAFT_170969 [Metschnikowia bicuspidata var. bicuspidata NRRL YB-4993]
MAPSCEYGPVLRTARRTGFNPQSKPLEIRGCQNGVTFVFQDWLEKKNGISLASLCFRRPWLVHGPGFGLGSGLGPRLARAGNGPFQCTTPRVRNAEIKDTAKSRDEEHERLKADNDREKAGAETQEIIEIGKRKENVPIIERQRRQRRQTRLRDRGTCWPYSRHHISHSMPVLLPSFCNISSNEQEALLDRGEWGSWNSGACLHLIEVPITLLCLQKLLY